MKKVFIILHNNLCFFKSKYLKRWKFSIDTRRSRNPVRRSNSSPEMSANWKNPFLNKEKLNVQQQIDKDFTCSELEIKLDAELKKHPKNIYTKDMRYIFIKNIYMDIHL